MAGTAMNPIDYGKMAQMLMMAPELVGDVIPFQKKTPTGEVMKMPDVGPIPGARRGSYLSDNQSEMGRARMAKERGYPSWKAMQQSLDSNMGSLIKDPQKFRQIQDLAKKNGWSDDQVNYALSLLRQKGEL
jgi:hypothetical protein